MPTKIYWIQSFEKNARIGIMPRPRGGDWLEDEISHFKRQNVTLIVSLLENDEVGELDLRKEEVYCLQYGIGFLRFPIKDRDVPVNARGLIQTLLKHLEEGAKIVIHCRMGIGRSAIIAGAVLVSKGYKASAVLTQISEVRGLKVPDTQEQVSWLIGMETHPY
ncbi:protein-tyrosine phosphatase family protein [Chitinophaga pinensis]|uniref:protein-tyrosine-phosphatase n=1 Tax=Chitinophaga pinensis (strain ATCC 43595 / DSM 2588 / LMG 13176 / NBRC 15968 / NCIMB 11800 / UQM 2034) TaxID=485918 RepID=A0A979GP36_CHIPD|nr:dual specificity protein phosphatase family protein [Chitinophaga pinensis]ACU59043.1 dual specificity protein phosphatase [Chitinophaga pinensis DSM 2588]